MTSTTFNGRTSTEARLRFDSSQVLGRVGHLMSKANSSQALCDVLGRFQQRSADGDDKIDYPREIVTSVCDVLGGVLGGTDGQS